MLNKVQEILEDLLDVELDEIQPETYLIRDLEAESIDLLELAIILNSNFSIKVNEDLIFLKRIREHISALDSTSEVQKIYQHLSCERIEEIKSELNNGPTLKVKDIISYLEWIG
ncbi:MAG: hypothetical protein KAS49_00480 [Candidatus Cloacimonetes bacterium]|nr:hypothetical protein [Candidatus Cloacimonadota bacterium]